MVDPAGFTLLIGMVPAPPPLVDAIQEIEIELSLEEASAFRIRFAITRTRIGDWSILDLDPFRPLVPIGIRIQRGLGPPEAVINGYVTEHEVTYGDEPGTATLEVTGLDATMLMNLQEKAIAWPNLPDGAIAAAIFGQYAMAPRVEPTSPVLIEPDGTTTQRGTDIRFLRRLARRNGFDCYVQPEPLSGLDLGHFHARSTQGVPQAVLSAGVADESNVSDFSIRYEMTGPTTAIAAGLDTTTKAPQPAVGAVAAEMPMGLEPTGVRQIPPGIARPADLGLPRTPELQKAIQAMVDRSAWSVMASGTTGLDVPVLRPGGLVAVRGPGRLYNGNYLVTRTHLTVAAGVFEQRLEARRNAVTMTGTELYVAVA
jgi:phage protein D